MSLERYHEMVAAMPDVGKSIQNALDDVGNAAITHSDALMVSIVVVMATGIMLWAFRHANSRKPVDEAEEMRKRLIQDQKYADAFGDKLFDMLCNDEIDRHEYKRACRRFGIAYRLGDLLTRKNPKRGLRYRVLHHLALNHATPSLVGKIPGPHPREDVPASFLVIKPMPVQRKVWLVAGKALLRRKSAD
jgi:hypothetical protein